MTEKTTDNPTSEYQNSPFYDAARRMLLASMGIISLAYDEIQVFLDQLVERGELVEKDSRRLMKEVKEFREKLERERDVRKSKVQAQASANTVTKADIDALNTRIAELTKKLEEMKKA